MSSFIFEETFIVYVCVIKAKKILLVYESCYKRLEIITKLTPNIAYVQITYLQIATTVWTRHLDFYVFQ